MKKLFTNCIEEAIFLLLFLVVYGSAIFFSVAYAGGGHYYLPDSEGNCGVISADNQDDIDFINHRGKYLMMIKADEMMTLNACNTGEFKCYRIKAACGEHVHTFVFWRRK